MSESDTTDSDHGIRYKTESTRHKNQPSAKYSLPEKDFLKSREKFNSHKHSRKKLKRGETDSSSDDEYHKQNSNTRRKQKRERYKSDKIIHKKDNSCKSPESSASISFGPALPPHLKHRLDSTNSELHNVPIGPALPPNLRQNSTESILVETEAYSTTEATVGSSLRYTAEHDEKNRKEVNTNVVGPDLPPKSMDQMKIGPILPPHLQPNISENEKELNNKECNLTPSALGPALPPHLIKENQVNDITEKLPDNDQVESVSQPIIGPALPPNIRQLLDNSGFIEEEENDIYGPIPEGTNLTRAHLELEERALQMRIDQLDPSKDTDPTREEWMLELPAVKRAAFGLGPRSFKMKAGPDLSDRSSWTDTPQDKAKTKLEPKIDLKEEARLQELRKRDKEQEEINKKHKKRKESLLDLHTKKMKTNKKDKEGPSERRPFSREVDLQVNRFDEAQKKAVLKKAQLLDNRFSTGEAKFL